jgi:hypothetical protein
MNERQEAGIVKIKCCDCGRELKGTAPVQPKAIAKAARWEHAGTVVWRCEDCVKEREAYRNDKNPGRYSGGV